MKLHYTYIHICRYFYIYICMIKPSGPPTSVHAGSHSNPLATFPLPKPAENRPADTSAAPGLRSNDTKLIHPSFPLSLSLCLSISLCQSLSLSLSLSLSVSLSLSLSISLSFCAPNPPPPPPRPPTEEGRPKACVTGRSGQTDVVGFPGV